MTIPSRRHVHMFAAAAALLAVLVLPVAAAAQAAQDLRSACAADAKKYCADEKPGGGRVLQCLKGHESDLAPDCKSALDAVAARIKDRRGQ